MHWRKLNDAHHGRRRVLFSPFIRSIALSRTHTHADDDADHEEDPIYL